MDLPILLIGPHSAGKSTVGKLLAQQLKLPFIHLWEVCKKYWQELGYDETLENQAWENDGADGVYRYMMPYEAYAVKRGVTEYSECVMELGSPQSVYDDADLFEQVCQVLKPYSHVVLLLPSEDVEESLQILKECGRVIINGMDINEHFVKHHSNHDLAKYIIYTKNKTPDQTSEDILAKIDPDASDIILIGPQGAGKSTIGRLLAKKLERAQVSMDQIRWDYYKEIGWNPEVQKQISDNVGFAGVYRYWKRFELYAVERLLKEHQNCVIDFGAGHSVYEDDADFARARELLAPYSNVVLLMPSPNLDESVAVLHQRGTLVNGMEANRFFTTHPSNRKLAKLVVYTKRKTPSETRDEILKRLELTH